jgi:uracil-DNA glycosylase family 4
MLSIPAKFDSIIKESPLYSSSKKIVLFRGQDESPEFLFVGEAPGKDENKLGKPFVGKSGETLNDWISKKGITSFGITNVVPLIPLGDDGKIRKPTPEELSYFQFLFDYIVEKVNPKHIIALGDSACMGVFGKGIRDCFHKKVSFNSIPATAIYHPMYYGYRNELEAGWEDFSKAIDLLSSYPPDEATKLVAHFPAPEAKPVEVEEVLKEQYSESEEDESEEEAEAPAKPVEEKVEYESSIKLPKQQVHNVAVKYMIDDKIAFFKVVGEMVGVEFKDIDSKEYFYWGNTKFYSYMKSATQGRDLIMPRVPDSEQIAIIYESPTEYELVGVVTSDEVRKADTRTIPGTGDVKYINFLAFGKITGFFKLKSSGKVADEDKPTKVQRYFPLHMHTEYSIGDGANRTDELAKVLYKMGFKGAGVSDHGHLNGTYYFQKDLGAKGLKTLLGCEMYVLDEPEFTKAAKKEKKGEEDKTTEDLEKKEKKHRYHITVYAKNAEGWKNLLELMWIASTDGFYYKPRILLKHLIEHKQGLVVLSGCLDGFVNWHIRELEFEKATKFAQMFKKEFGEDYYFEVMPHWEIEGFAKTTKMSYQIAQSVGVKTTVSLDCHYTKKEDKTIHNAVLAINKRKLITECGYTGNTYYVMDDEELKTLMVEKIGFSPDEVEEMFKVSMEIGDKCNFRIEKFKSVETMPNFPNSTETLRKLVYDEFVKRPFKDNPVYKERLDFELDRILTKGYEGYFLMIKDIIDTARELGVMYGPGRGSVSGSLVAYLLKLHDADPIEHDLLFDRFISDMRKDMPDVDMDFQDSGRERLIERLIEKYGADRVSGIMAFSKLHGKGAVRDIARIYDIDRGEAEKVASLVVTRSGGDARQNFSLADTFNEFEGAKEFKVKHPEASEVAISIEGRVRTLTKHAAGLIITRYPVKHYFPVYRVNGTIVAGWEKKALEDLGLVKMDVLGLKALDVVARCVETTKCVLPLKFDDPKVYETVFKVGNTPGIFQFESQGLTKFIADLECSDFDTLTDASALYRPGPLHSGMSTTYLQRKKGQKETVYEHELLKKITEKTYGIMIYQEQIMRIMHDIGGFSWSTSEMIRKVISKSMGKSLFEELQEKFVKHASEVLQMKKEDAEKIYNATSMFGCLTGDTILYRCSSNQHKGREITLEEAFEYQDTTNFKIRGLCVLSMSNDGFVRYNKIKQIWSTGHKKVYYIRTASNKFIRASEEHRFLVNDDWKMVKDMSEGDWIRTSDLKLPEKLYGDGYGSGPHNQPSPRQKEGTGFTNDEISQKKKLIKRYHGKCQICGSKKHIELHHIDGSHKDNSDENTMLLCRKCHRAQSKSSVYKRYAVGYPTQNERIVEIKCIGERQTYDVEMAEEPRNFIANGFVSHNSYGFNRSHSCTYSILSYWMAFLKTYHPAVFFSVLLDRESDPEMARRYVTNAKKMGVDVIPPDVNLSQSGYSMTEDGKTVSCGLTSIKGIGDAAVKKVLAGRPYKNVEDLVKGVAKGVFKVLVQSGAADSIIPSRKWCLDHVDDIYEKKKFDFSKVPEDAAEFSEKEKMMKQNEVLDFYSDKHICTFFKDPFGTKIKYEKIHEMKFEGYVTERWVKGAVTFINFKQEGLEGSWMLFQDSLLERKYAHLNVNDEWGGNIHIHLAPEQYTYYKRTLERKKFPVIIKGHTIPEHQKIYCDAMIVMDAVDYDNPIFDYVNGKAKQKCDAIKRRVIESRQKSIYVGVVVSATYKVKDKTPYVRIVFADGNMFVTREISQTQIYVAGHVLKAKQVGKGTLAEVEIF